MNILHAFLSLYRQKHCISMRYKNGQQERISKTSLNFCMSTENMLKSLVNKYLKAFLGEVFLNAPSAQLSIGADLFSDSNLRLDDLTFRPDIFDINLQPFRLISGHLGTLNIEGITELALAGKVKFTGENIFLLFHIDTSSDAEHIQTLKKIQLEMRSGKLTSSIFKELMKRIQGFPADKEPDIGKRRKVVFKALDTAFKGLNFALKNIHIRFEIQQSHPSGMQPSCVSLGVVIPLIKFTPNNTSANGSSGNNKSSQSQQQSLGGDSIQLSIKGFHCYCDYGRDSYTLKGSDDASIAKQFLERWKVEKHNLVLHPTDIEFIVLLNIKKKSGLLLPQVTVRGPEVRFSIDEKQLEVLRQVSEAVAFAHKRFQQLLRLQKIFRNGFPLPRIYEIGGVRILPHLLVRNNPYPAEDRLAEETMPTGALKRKSASALVDFMRERVGDRWAKMMWLHIGRLVIHDVRLQLPFRRWIEIAKLANIRRKYCFIYSKLLKLSKETGNFVFDVNANVKAETLRQLFEYEMQLPISTILKFRSLAAMVAHVEHFNLKRKQQQSKAAASAASTGSRNSFNLQPFERISISWTDILRIFIEYNEAKRETAFHRFDRKNFDDDSLINGTVYDDASTSKASDDGSVYSFSLQSRAPVSHALTALSPPEKMLHSRSSSSSSTFSIQQQASTSSHHQTAAGSSSGSPQLFRSSVISVSSMQSSAMKLLGNINISSIGDSKPSTGTHSHHSDEGDIKISSKFDLSVFSDFFSSLSETEEKLSEHPVEKKPDSAVSVPSKDFTKFDLHDFQLTNGKPPHISSIAEAVQWALLRHQKSVVLMPPDITVNFEKISADLRTVHMPPPAVREKLLAVSWKGVSVVINISQSSHQAKGGSSGGGANASQIKSLRGFASLSGALLQFRLVSKQFGLSVFADRELAAAAQKEVEATVAQHDSLFADRHNANGKGTMLSAGLPAYPASTEKPKKKPVQNQSTKQQIPSQDSVHDDPRDQIGEINREIFGPKEAKTTTIHGVKHQPGKTIYQSVKDMEENDDDERGSMDGATEEALLQMLEYQNSKLFGPAVEPAMKPVGEVGSAKHVLHVPGTTVLDSSNMVRRAVSPSNQIEPADTKVDKEESGALSVKSGESSPDKDDKDKDKDKGSGKVPAGTDSGPVEKVVLCSSADDNFFVLCVILDLDDKGEGAADVQVQVGGLKSDLCRVALSAVAGLPLLSAVGHIGKSLQQLRQLRPLLPSLPGSAAGERALLVDRALLVPLVSVSLFVTNNGPKKTNSAKGKKENEEAYQQRLQSVAINSPLSPLTSETKIEDDDYISSDKDTASDEDDDESDLEGESVTLLPLDPSVQAPVLDTTATGDSKGSVDSVQAKEAEKRRRREAALYNKNIHQWVGLLDSYLPRVLSVCVRMSPASIEFVESSVIRDFIFSKIHDVVNRASERFRKSSEKSDAYFLSGALHLLNTLFLRQKASNQKSSSSIRKWGSKHHHNLKEDLLFVVPSAQRGEQGTSSSSKKTVARSHVSVPAFDMILTKAAVPYPALDIHMLGLQIKLPVTDETLCNLLGLLLGHFFPFYY